jgi:16S rRNA (uracil1498-N3)-methyltransferase
MDLIKNLRFPRFFIKGEDVIVTGDDAKHISTVLRMRVGEKAVLCSDNGYEYPSEIVSVSKDNVEFRVLAKREIDSEPNVYVRLFQCVPKGEKLDFVVQKATELGVSEIYPVISKRCVSRPDKKSGKITRLQKIAEQAAKQSGRGIVPKIHGFMSFNDSLKLYNKEYSGIIFYENGGERLNSIVGNSKYIDIFIGSEGGFETGEIEAAMQAGIKVASLGKRILRAETAPIAAIAILMNLTGDI